MADEILEIQAESLEFDHQKRVIYPNGAGGVAVVIPAPDALVSDVLKAVPEGLPYKIIDAADVPADRSLREAWEYVE